MEQQVRERFTMKKVFGAQAEQWVQPMHSVSSTNTARVSPAAPCQALTGLPLKLPPEAERYSLTCLAYAWQQVAERQQTRSGPEPPGSNCRPESLDLHATPALQISKAKPPYGRILVTNNSIGEDGCVYGRRFCLENPPGIGTARAPESPGVETRLRERLAAWESQRS